MNSMEQIGVNTVGEEKEENKKDLLLEKVYSLMKDFPPANCEEEEMRERQKRLGSEIEKMSREELINFAMDIRQRLEESQSGVIDENMYLRFATVYGLVCSELEKLEENK